MYTDLPRVLGKFEIRLISTRGTAGMRAFSLPVFRHASGVYDLGNRGPPGPIGPPGDPGRDSAPGRVRWTYDRTSLARELGSLASLTAAGAKETEVELGACGLRTRRGSS